MRATALWVSILLTELGGFDPKENLQTGYPPGQLLFCSHLHCFSIFFVPKTVLGVILTRNHYVQICMLAWLFVFPFFPPEIRVPFSLLLFIFNIT